MKTIGDALLVASLVACGKTRRPRPLPRRAPRGLGFDIDPQRIKESNANAKKAGVENLVRFEKKNIFEVDLTLASIVTLSLLPELSVKSIPQLEKLKPGSRVIAHDFDMEGIEPEKWRSAQRTSASKWTDQS